VKYAERSAPSGACIVFLCECYKRIAPSGAFSLLNIKLRF